MRKTLNGNSAWKYRAYFTSEDRAQQAMDLLGIKYGFTYPLRDRPGCMLLWDY